MTFDPQLMNSPVPITPSFLLSILVSKVHNFSLSKIISQIKSKFDILAM